MKFAAPLAAASALALLCGTAAVAQVTNSTTATVVTDNATGQVQAAGIAGTTATAPVANPPPRTTPPTTANADTGYSGALHGQAFHEIEPRIAELQGKAHGNRKATAMLSKIQGEAKYRRARHGGELRDWDRELLNKQLDQVQAMLGA